MSRIIGKMSGCYSPMGKTFILQDADGADFATAVVTEQEQVLDATPKDVRMGSVYAGSEGIKTGENTITYRTSEGSEYILPNADFRITALDLYDTYNYTKLQCVVAKYVSSTDKTATEKIVLNDNVYEVGSSVAVSTVTKNAEEKTIDLNITNNTEDIYIIYYFTYTQEEV